MSVHDAVNEYRKRLVRVIERSPNKRRACREAGIHHSTFYRWRKSVLAQTQPPRTPGRPLSWAEHMIESRIVAKALAYPALGPHRIADELARDELVVSASRVWRTLRRHRLNTKALRYLLLHVHRDGAPPMRVPAVSWIGELDATVPGDLIQMDCFHVGSFKETRLRAGKHHQGHIWQYTAIDVASSWTWAELWATGHNPSAALTSRLAHRVAADLTRWGWTWRALSTDNGNEYRAHQFQDTIKGLGVEHRFIRAGRPQTNGKVERVQGTILQECYQPALINYTIPSITGLRRDLADYLTHYNWTRPHRGKWNQGQTPAAIIQPDTKLTP